MNGTAHEPPRNIDACGTSPAGSFLGCGLRALALRGHAHCIRVHACQPADPHRRRLECERRPGRAGDCGVGGVRRSRKPLDQRSHTRNGPSPRLARPYRPDDDLGMHGRLRTQYRDLYGGACSRRHRDRRVLVHVGRDGHAPRAGSTGASRARSAQWWQRARDDDRSPVGKFSRPIHRLARCVLRRRAARCGDARLAVCEPAVTASEWPSERQRLSRSAPPERGARHGGCRAVLHGPVRPARPICARSWKTLRASMARPSP